jgi:AcrR family transcriptional regulator
MAVPAQRTPSGLDEEHPTVGARATAVPWTTLDAGGKRSRLLEAAETVFARDGLGAPVPAIAAAAGVGVGSVYRAFAAKDEIVAALAVQRLRWVQERADHALEDPDPWSAFEGLVRTVAERQSADGVLAEALAAALQRPEVAEPLAAARAAGQAVVDRAYAHGALRTELTTDDLRAIFAALRAADAAEPGCGPRVLELILAGLRAPE